MYVRMIQQCPSVALNSSILSSHYHPGPAHPPSLPIAQTELPETHLLLSAIFLYRLLPSSFNPFPCKRLLEKELGEC